MKTKGCRPFGRVNSRSAHWEALCAYEMTEKCRERRTRVDQW